MHDPVQLAQLKFGHRGSDDTMKSIEKSAEVVSTHAKDIASVVKHQYINFASVTVTVSLVLTNKVILDHTSDPRIVVMLVPLHLLCTLMVTSFGGVVENRIPHRWLILNAAAGIFSLYGSMYVLKLSTVSFQQIGRLLSVPLSAVVDRFFWNEAHMSLSKYLCILGIVIGVLLVSSDVSEVSLEASVINIFAVCGQVGSQTVVKLLAHKFAVTSREHLKQSIPYTLAASLLPVFLSWITDNVKGNLQHHTELLSGLPPSVLFCVVLSCILGVAVQLLATFLGQVSSTVSYALLTLSKSVCTISIAAVFLAEKLPLVKVIGTALSLVMFFRFLSI